MASNNKTGDMDFIFSKIKDGAKIKTKAEKKKLKPSLQEEGQHEEEQNLHELQAKIDSKIIVKAEESPVIKVDRLAEAKDRDFESFKIRVGLRRGRPRPRNKSWS